MLGRRWSAQKPLPVYSLVVAGTNVISLEINAFQGGHTAAYKQVLIQEFTEAIRRHAGIAQGALVPVYILFRDVPESDWGVFGATIYPA